MDSKMSSKPRIIRNPRKTCADMLLDLVSDKIETRKDRYHDAIVESFNMFPGRSVQFSEIYYHICIRLGASHEDALKGITICPYTCTKKDIRGLIRSWVEERSPHSRQYYWRGGVRWNNKNPLLFVNDGLAEKNEACNWMPYNHVRGNGWRYDPAAARAYIQPSEDILSAATAAYRKTGMQGKSHTASSSDQVSSVRVVNPRKALAVGAAMITAATIHCLVR